MTSQTKTQDTYTVWTSNRNGRAMQLGGYASERTARIAAKRQAREGFVGDGATVVHAPTESPVVFYRRTPSGVVATQAE
jgi:hypothetical protein